MSIAAMWKPVAKGVITLALFAWLVNYANVSFVEIFSNLALASPAWLLLALALFLLHTLLVYFAWHRSLALFAIDSTPRQTAPLFAFSALTKYIPGGIWHAGSRVWVLGRQGQSRVLVLFSVILESIYSLAISAVLLCLLFALLPTGFLPQWATALPPLLIVLAGLILLAALLTPAFYRLVFNWYYAARLGTGQVSRFRFMRLLELVALHAGALLVFVAGYYLSFVAFLPAHYFNLAQFAFIVLLATFSGFIAIFSPAGLGVRESVLFLLFATLIDSPLLVTLCLAPRLLMLVAEVIYFVLTRLIRTTGYARGQASAP